MTITSVTIAIFHTNLRIASTRSSTVVYASLTLQRPPLLLPKVTSSTVSSETRRNYCIPVARCCASRPALTSRHVLSSYPLCRSRLSSVHCYSNCILLYSAHISPLLHLIRCVYISLLSLPVPFWTAQYFKIHEVLRGPHSALNCLSHYVLSSFSPFSTTALFDHHFMRNNCVAEYLVYYVLVLIQCSLCILVIWRPFPQMPECTFYSVDSNTKFLSNNYLANLSPPVCLLSNTSSLFVVLSSIVPFKDPRANWIRGTSWIAHCRPDPSLAAIHDATQADFYKLFNFSLYSFV